MIVYSFTTNHVLFFVLITNLLIFFFFFCWLSKIALLTQPTLLLFGESSYFELV